MRPSCGLRARLTAIAFVAFAIVYGNAQDRPIEAWWLHATFSPTETQYESLPVSAIDPKWTKIAILSYFSLPPDAKEDIRWMQEDGFVFQVDDYFRPDEMSDRELCGVFEDREGHRGRFLLVLERPKVGDWKVAFLHQELGDAGFSVLRRAKGMFWGTCLQCDEFSRLRMKQKHFYLESSP